MLLNLEGFQCATSLDLNMGYYHIDLCASSREMCTIALPFGKCECQRLPMGLCNSPDIFQEKMSELFDGLDFVRAHIDDLLILTKGTHEDHLEKLEQDFFKLRKAGLKVNAQKSFFARGKLEYLGYWITRTGIQPMKNKVEAIMKITEPANRKQFYWCSQLLPRHVGQTITHTSAFSESHLQQHRMEFGTETNGSLCYGKEGHCSRSNASLP